MPRCVVTASKRLSDLIRRPYDLYRAGVLDEYLMGLMNQVAQAMDDSITQEVSYPFFDTPFHRVILNRANDYYNLRAAKEL